MSRKGLLSAAALLSAALATHAQSPTPEILHPSLQVSTVVSGLALPIGVAFLDPDDMLVLEKDRARSSAS